MSDKVTELTVISTQKNSVTKNSTTQNSTTIFDREDQYIIPLYQRAFAWEEKQLVQLMEDINDIAENAHYYIGSLIVSRQRDSWQNNSRQTDSGQRNSRQRNSEQENVFEVVDGQQRLTSLYLLLSCLGVNVKHTLSFACRDKANYTLNNIQALVRDNQNKLDSDRIDRDLHQGVKIISEKINEDTFNRNDFLEKLQRVIVYRIEVPEHTDLNRYFEIMNTRGEQLEQHDIVKAKLMSFLHTENARTAFARIWEACSDMTGYVQMHFNRKEREWLFGNSWNELPFDGWQEYEYLAELSTQSSGGFFISEIVKKDVPSFSADHADEEDSSRVRFESIIDFPYFLLHVLKVFVRIHFIKNKDTRKEWLNELLDDKKLIDSFNRVIEHGVMGKIPLSSLRGKNIFSRYFILCLLQCRFLFDKYIIKREYVHDDSDGVWSLKELRASGRKSNKRPYYINTIFTKSREPSAENDRRTRTNCMLQSALRVSYTSPKVMHWITELLFWLLQDDCANNSAEALSEYTEQIENIAIDAVIENFFAVCPDDTYVLGTNTPHIVFNYLDFLLWRENERKYSDFTFEFRNSVEHWYPQNPSQGTFPRWEDGVDRFGNLCLIQRSVNTKFSNMSPEAKKSTFHEMIAKGSLKLRVMSELTEKKGSRSANVRWKENVCEAHEKTMIHMLEDACGIE